MTAEEKIRVDNNWKELVKNMVDKCDNLNDFQKEIMKFCLEMQHGRNKKKIINQENKNSKRKYVCSTGIYFAKQE